ncbi:hypothetical protein B5P43_15760 [Bacillus sp. SRB_336]|nr:hypothetical protein B5P43_15760 [Bacillus sp. SRB_336]
MQTLTAPSVHLTDDLTVELNANALKVDVDHAEAVRAALVTVGLRTKLINRHWPESRTRYFEVVWGNQTAEEKSTDLKAARAALVRAGFELGL